MGGSIFGLQRMMHKKSLVQKVIFHVFSGNANCWIVESLEEVERLQGNNKYWCSRCEHLVEAERSVEFHCTPDILTIQLKRFSAFSSA
jgi:ubiquitin C-terminal hydrolase